MNLFKKEFDVSQILVTIVNKSNEYSFPVSRYDNENDFEEIRIPLEGKDTFILDKLCQFRKNRKNLDAWIKLDLLEIIVDNYNEILENINNLSKESLENLLMLKPSNWTTVQINTLELLSEVLD